MTDTRPINYEQLEAEQQAGLHVMVRFDFSQTALAHVVMAVQLAKRYPLNPGSRALFQDFIKEALRVGGFSGETLRLMAQREAQP